MKPNTEKRNKWLNIRMSPAEYEQVAKLSSQTTCHSLSDYARKTVLGKPIVMRYRNQSLDEFTSHMLQLRNELNAIGNNINQAVRQLYSLRHQPDIQEWILHNEQDKTQLFRKIETISQQINQAYQLWSRD